jgi:hypothetical protein
MVAAADESLQALGAENLQAVIVCHTDQKHPHVHVILNRIAPETGKLHTFSNDRVKLSDWANAYERERGQILTPRREEKRLARAAFNVAGAISPDRLSTVKPRRPTVQSAERQKTEAALLKGMSDAQRERHKAEWSVFSRRSRETRNCIYSGFRQRLAVACAAHKGANRALWAQHFRQARDDQRAFEQREQRLVGVIRNALDAATHQQATGQAPDRGKLSLTFQNVFFAQARAEAFTETQQLGRRQLARNLKAALDVEIGSLRDQRAAALSAQRLASQQERSQLISRQDDERTKMRTAWRQVYERREKDPRYQRRQNAGSPSEQTMKKDFDNARQEQQPQRSLPTERKFVSNPAPSPSPAGAPPMSRRTAQNVPMKDWGEAKTASPQPQLKKDWASKETPQKQPEIKPLPARDRSRDRSRDR